MPKRTERCVLDGASLSGSGRSDEFVGGTASSCGHPRAFRSLLDSVRGISQTSNTVRPMDDSVLLGQLSLAYGLADHYFDIWGHRHVVSSETQRSVLRAMGVAVESSEDLRQSLASLHARYWCRLCDPVLVVHDEGLENGWGLRVQSEADQDRAWTVSWILTSDGETTSLRGSLGPGCPVAETAWVEGARYVGFRLPVPERLPLGYYTLRVRLSNGSREVAGTSLLVVAPSACYVPPAFWEGRGTWGLWVQLYSVRSQRNWGIGDFTDLASLTEWVGGELGGGAVGVNPLHALKNTRPHHISPYSPHSRSFLNEVYIDPERVPEFARCEAAQRLVRSEAFLSRLEGLKKSEFVDYEGVHRLKLEVLELLYRQFVDEETASVETLGRPAGTGTERSRDFARYCAEQGEALEGFALYRALAESFERLADSPRIWREWPMAYRHPQAPAVASFRARHLDRIRFFQYVQWQAEEQLGAVARSTRAMGMPIGLYHDFALGSDPNGAEGWQLQDVLVLDVDCGCPPDAFALQGQNWGFPPFHPIALREAAYRPFIELLRQNLRRGGALRLDHVMGLFRLFWIPKGQSPATGAYVEYPYEDLLGILALESHRAKTLVIGEDLGTVPDWIRDRLARAQAFSYRVWYFERNGDGSWKSPTQYPLHSLAVTTTHDLPTLPGFWRNDDLLVRERLDLFPDAAVRQRVWEGREHDKQRMLEALRAHGGWTGPNRADEIADGVPSDVVDAVHRFLSRTSSLVVLASLDDWLGERAQANLPGTVDEYPNWLRKTSMPLETIRQDPQCRRLARLMMQERGGGRETGPSQAAPDVSET